MPEVSSEHVWISCRRLPCTEFGNGEGQRGHKLLVRIEDVLGNLLVEERRIRRDAALVLALVAVCRDEIGAIRWAIDGDLALRAATHSTDLLGFGRAEARRFAFFTDRAGHGLPSTDEDNPAEYAVH